MKNIFDYIVAVLAAGALKVIRLVPRPAARSLLRGIAKICCLLFVKQRNIVLVNLRLAMPGLSPQQAKEIATETFFNIGMATYELSCLPALKNKCPEEMSNWLIFPEEVFQTIQALTARGKGLLYLTGHFGAWELLPNAHAIFCKNIPLSIVVRPLDNPWLNRLINNYRTCLGNRLLPKKNSLRAILDALRQGGAVGILLDQNVCREEGVFVDFFGKEACTNFGLAALALRTGTPVLPVALFYDKTAGRYFVHMEPEIFLVRTGNKAQDIRTNTALFTQALATMVQKYPDQWLWVHRRWKTRPADSKEKIY